MINQKRIFPPAWECWEKVNEDWWVDQSGSLWCEFGGYEIASSLLQRDWGRQLQEKSWYDRERWVEAYKEGCRRAGIQMCMDTVNTVGDIMRYYNEWRREKDRKHVF